MDKPAIKATIQYVFNPDAQEPEYREFFWRYRAEVYGYVLEGYAMSLAEARQTMDERIDKKLKALEPETW